VKSNKERKPLPPKKLEIRNLLTKTSKPNKRLKTKQRKKHKRRPLATRRNDFWHI
jgi:hypothetical protein